MQSIGERLKEARERKGVSVREAAEATKIRGDYLQKFENNKFDFGLTPLYVRSFLRNYAKYLKAPADRLVADFDALGYGEPGVPRPVNREVYGRVDFGASDSTEPRAESPAPAAAANAAATTTARKPAARPQPAKTALRIGPALGESENRTMLIQLGTLLGGGGLVLLLVIWGVSALFSSKPKPVVLAATPPVAERTIAPDSPAVRQPVPARQAVLTALGPVRVQVWEATPNPDPAKWIYGKVVLAETSLARGESRPVPKAGALIISASVPDNLLIETATQSIKLAEEKTSFGASKYIEVR